jgi:hypothetical protein
MTKAEAAALQAIQEAYWKGLRPDPPTPPVARKRKKPHG